jgi:hypothetical protein
MYSLGFFSLGTEAAMIVNTPFITPAPPRPWIALPMINMFEEYATALIIFESI